MLGKSPSWQDADGACSGYLIEEDGTPCCSTAATACSRSCAASATTSTVDAVVISHLHADHFLDLVPFSYALTYAPRQQPVPVDRWPGTDTRRGRSCYAPPRRARDVPPRRRRVGQRGPDRERVRPRGVRRRTTCSRSARCAFRFHDVPHFTETFAIDIASTNGGGRITYGADCCAERRARRVRARHRPADGRGDAAAPRARRACAAT